MAVNPSPLTILTSSVNLRSPNVPFPRPGSILLYDNLGSGTYATVYKGITKSNKQTVAVKCIERKRLTTLAAENLLTEIKVMKQLKHKHIVSLLDFEVCFF
jgi:serine/threonine protein kinase